MSDPKYTLVEYVAADRFAVSNAAKDSFVSEFAVGLRLRADCQADGIRLGSVTGAIHDAGTGRTLVNVLLDSGAVLTTHLTWVLHGNDVPDSLCHHGHTGPADGGDLPGVMLTNNSRAFSDGYIRAEGSYTGFMFTQLGAPLDAKKSIYHVADSRVALLLTDDAETVFHEAWSVGRIGATPTDMTVNPLLLAAGGLETPTLNGESLAGGIVSTYLGLSVRAEVSVTGGSTLTPAAFGKMHVCTGTAADYTVGLPAAAGNAGKLLGLRIGNACTKLVTLDGNASELIDGALTRIMWAGESALLLCDGVGWTKIAGKSIPMVCKLAATSVQSLPSGSFTSPRYDVKEIDNASMGNLSSGSVTTRRAGFYIIATHASLLSAVTWQINIFGTGGAASSAASSALLPILVQLANLAGGTGLVMNILQNSGSAVSTNSLPYPYLSVQEVVLW